MMRRRSHVLVFSALVAWTFIAATPAGSIVNGELDGNGHPAVAGLIAELEVEPGVFEKFVGCSGSLISASPPVVLTAGHCTAILSSIGVAKTWVSFDPVIDVDTSTLIPVVSIHTHPGFTGVNTTQGPHDIGVMVLAHAPAGVTPVDLPEPGLLDSFRAEGTLKGRIFTAVGYGVQTTITGPPTFTNDGARRVADLPFLAMPRGWLVLSQALNATGLGGACFGDSGSPKFLPGTNTIVAVESWGDAVCRATSFSWRLDTASSRDFLDDFVPVP